MPAALAPSPLPEPVTIDSAWDATFVPLDPPRASFFALWLPARPAAIELSPTAGLKRRTVELFTPATASSGVTASSRATASSGAHLEEVTSVELTIRQAIDVFVALPANAPVTPSVRVWAAVVRTALNLVAQGRLLPAISGDDWDAWRVGPREGHHEAHLDALAAALPPVGHARPAVVARRGDEAATTLRMMSAGFAVRYCLDAVADRMVRAPASAEVSASALFAQLQPTRVPHLRTWVDDLSGRLCRESHLDIVIKAPLNKPAPPDEPASPDELAEARSGGDRGGDAARGVRVGEWRIEFALRSVRDPSLVVGAADVWARPHQHKAAFGTRADVDLILALREAAECCPVLAPALALDEPRTMSLDDDSFDAFLDGGDALEAAGVTIRWAESLTAGQVDRRLVVGAGAPAGGLEGGADLESLLSVDWEFLLDGLPLTPAELDELSRAKRSIVPVRGRWVRLSARSRQALRTPPPEMDLGGIIGAALAGRLELGPGDGLFGPGIADDEGEGDGGGGGDGSAVEVMVSDGARALIDRLRGVVEGREAPEPPGLQATLRPYQRRGLAWMSDLVDMGLGGCLADDMGLGKTIQVLSLHRSRTGRTLVVCPTSLLANWQREAERFVPDVPVRRYYGANRNLDAIPENALVLTTYGLVRSDAELLADVDWALVVADEAQHAKNPRSRTARALRQIPSASRLALTGTPVENRLTELWSIMDWAVPGLLGRLDDFRRRVALPIERDDSTRVAEELAEVLRPFLLRRVKSDPTIAPDLAAKTEHDVVVPLTTEQVTLYHATVEEILVQVRRAEGAQRHGLVLKLLTALKQITNHPAQYLGQTRPLAGRSGKLDALDHLVDQSRAAGESMLIFSQYVTMGELLVDHLRSRGLDVEILHGGLTIGARQALVDRFQDGELPLLVLSLKAAGTGLNLTQATQVVHFDRWWNPAVEDQATDRAHRIGQRRHVSVHRLITEGTVEDRVAALLEQKRQLADRIIGGGEAWISSLGDEELTALVALDDEGNGPG